MSKLFLAVFVLVLSFQSFAQNKPDASFTQEDWDKLSQSAKDSINKVLLKKFEEARKASQTVEEENANRIINEALQNANGTTSLTITSFPKAQLRDDITKLKNLEEFACL